MSKQKPDSRRDFIRQVGVGVVAAAGAAHRPEPSSASLRPSHRAG